MADLGNPTREVGDKIRKRKKAVKCAVLLGWAVLLGSLWESREHVHPRVTPQRGEGVGHSHTKFPDTLASHMVGAVVAVAEWVPVPRGCPQARPGRRCEWKP